MQALLRTPLYDWHLARSARMVEFGGWEMPVQYSSVIQEHEAVRKNVGLTDVSHMGRLIFEGPGTAAFLNSVLSRNVEAIEPGQVRYSLLTNLEGGIIDDLLVSQVKDLEHNKPPYFLLVVNASNKNKDVAFLKRFLTPEVAQKPGSEVRMIDESLESGMIAIQGPRSVELLQPFFNEDLSAMKYYSGTESMLCNGGRWCYISRTGYTGEDGFEIVLESFFLEQFVEQIFEAGRDLGILPVGLAARDTLRLEAGMPLYGHELTEQTNPFEAGVAYALYLDGPFFPGRNVLRNLKDKPLQKVRIGLELLDKRPAREGCELYVGDKKIGWITSGTFSPTLQKPIAMGYVLPDFSLPGQSLFVDVRGKMLEAKVVPLPFYKRTA